MNAVCIDKSRSRGLALSAVVALLGLGVTLPACSAQDTNAAASGNGDPEVVARVAGEPVTMADLEEAAAGQLAQIEAQRQKILEQTLGQVVEQKLIEVEAAAQGVEPEALLASEVEGKVGAVSDAEIDAWYEQNKERVRQPKEQVAERIREFLQQQRVQPVRNQYMASLREKHKVRILLEPPRAEVAVADSPTKGPDSAPVTIVEFSDFECPYCSRVNPTLEQVMENYGDKVQVAFRHFPLPNHTNAPKAAEASMCAHDQGKFWEMHDAMFANQRALGVEQLKATAGELGLDGEQFAQCLDSDKYAEKVQKDLEAGQAAGVTGTPAMFVNGRLVSGAVPYDQIASVIDDELERRSDGD